MEKNAAGCAVSENDTCPWWAPGDEPSVAILRECWFCKWSDFRTDPDTYRHTGLCHNPKKQNKTEEAK